MYWDAHTFLVGINTVVTKTGHTFLAGITTAVTKRAIGIRAAAREVLMSGQSQNL